ncbi:UDP-glycosyltransferase 74E2-like [Cucumis melo var. makuwa]|uniref:Glycosyltransferase n=1 Tax=Cucumis melo var. makuwa TaxID=1194695 RepID=A0A5A7UMC8_CUCMM|nr:UDP-glycosyltransferase 74E2-like [Cucumis melo var. makuwa]TYK05211.1 UDP-glycosyltransferase 74E2-like [Cucumis melo var. makuwa]
MGEDEKQHGEGHVVVVACPTQGHLNPLLQFAKYLAHQGIHVTIPVTFANPDSSSFSHNNNNFPLINLQQVSLLPYSGTEPESSMGLWGRRLASIRLHLVEFLASCDHSVSCIVYDSMMPWILDIAKQFRVSAASFFTQSFAVNAIYYSLYKGCLDIPLGERFVCLDHGFPALRSSDISTFLSDPTKHVTTIEFMTKQFAALDEADWVFINSFDSLEPQESVWIKKQLPFISIGPMIPSIYLNGWLPKDKDYGLSMFEPNNEDSTMKWIDSQEKSSIVYVSFGSLTEAKEELMEEVAWGLKLTNRPFLWVVRESEFHKLPHNFIENIAGKGLVVKWCSQLQVLTHKSVGCFVTHCGWNSTLEALSLGVPLVVMPQWSDQPTNAKYAEDVWKIGKRVRMEEDGLCRRAEIEICINQVMEGEDCKEIRENLNKWRELAKATMEEGGISNTNINHFVKQILRKTQL